MARLSLQSREVKARIVARKSMVESAEIGEKGLERAAKQELGVSSDCGLEIETLEIGQKSRRSKASFHDGMPLPLRRKHAFDGVALCSVEVRTDRAEHVRIGEMKVGQRPNAETPRNGIDVRAETGQDLTVVRTRVRRIEVGWVVHDPSILEDDQDRGRHADSLLDEHWKIGSGEKSARLT
jgi:hypothetical protein